MGDQIAIETIVFSFNDIGNRSGHNNFVVIIVCVCLLDFKEKDFIKITRIFKIIRSIVPVKYTSFIEFISNNNEKGVGKNSHRPKEFPSLPNMQVRAKIVHWTILLPTAQLQQSSGLLNPINHCAGMLTRTLRSGAVLLLQTCLY